MAQYVEGPYIVEDQPDGTRKVVGYANQQQSNVVAPNPRAAQSKELDNIIKNLTIQGKQKDLLSGDKPQTIQRKDGSIVQVSNGQVVEIAGPTENADSSTLSTKLTAKERSDAISQFLAADRVLRQQGKVQGLFDESAGSTDGFAGLLDYLPTPKNDRLNTSGQRLRADMKKLQGFTGGEGNTLGEASLLYDPFLVSSRNLDQTAQDKIDNMADIAADARREAIMILGGVPDANGRVTPLSELTQLQTTGQAENRDDMAVAGNAPPSSGNGPQGPDRSNVMLGDPVQPDRGGYAPYGAQYRTVDNPALAGVNTAIGKMIAQGASREEIAAFAASKGVTLPPNTKWGQETPAGRAWMKQNPGKPYPVNVDDMVVPMSGFEQFRNNAPQTRIGTMAATGLNAGGFGIPQAIAGGQGLDYLRSVNPKMAFAGDIAGVIGGTAALGRAGGAVAGKLAPSLLGGGGKAAAGRQLATDATYGAIYGGATEGDPLTGAATATIGSGLGMGAGQAIKSAIAPSGGKLAGVMADGARPTLGQRFVNSGGPIGKMVNGIEEVFKSYPGLGAAVDASREAGRRSWQGAGFQRALAAIDDRLPSGVTEGPDAFKYTRQAFDDTYDKARSGMQFVPDQGYQQDFGQWQQNWLNGGLLDSEGINQVEKAISTRVGSRMRNGVLTGDTYKKAVSDLNSTINNIGKPEVKKALAEYRTVLDAAARRNSDPAAVALMDKADLGYSQFKPLKEAARRAGSEPGYFTPQGLAAVDRQQMGKTNAFIEGDTRLGDYIKQGDNFRDRVPNSGTPERLLTIQGIASPVVGTAGFFNPATLAAAGLTLPYMPIVEKGAKALIAPRGGKAKKVGGIFGSRKAQKALGAAGAGAGVGTLPYIIE